MIETATFKGLFEVYTNTIYPADFLRDWLKQGRSLADLPEMLQDVAAQNVLMADQKLLMANAVYPNIDKLVITNQTATPADTETSYSGTIYTTVSADEFYRSADVNPYQVAWNITSDSANGNWGSFVLITAAGAMINRALAGITKLSGTGKIIQFTGSVV